MSDFTKASDLFGINKFVEFHAYSWISYGLYVVKRNKVLWVPTMHNSLNWKTT